MIGCLLFLFQFTILSVLYFAIYCCKLYFKKNEDPNRIIILATYDAQLPEPEPVRFQSGSEPQAEAPPPSYEEAIRVYRECIAEFGLRHRNSEEVRREDLGERFSEMTIGGNGERSEGRNGDANRERNE